MKTRRDFLNTTSGAAVIAATTGVAESTTGTSIDAHVHVWTPDTKQYPLAEGISKDRMKPASFTPEELFAVCRPSGVSRVVLIQMSFYKTDNSYMLDMMARYPGAFSGVAIIDETGPNVRSTMKDLAGQGVRGFRLYANKENVAKWQDTPGMLEMWGAAADMNLSMCLLANADALPGALDMCKRFPKTPVVIDHFARIGVSGEINAAELDHLLQFAKFENVYVKTSAFYALGKKVAPYTDLGPMIKKLRDEFGANRLMWASDCPYQIQKEHTYDASIGLIRDRLDFLSDADKTWMLQKTAQKVFFD